MQDANHTQFESMPAKSRRLIRDLLEAAARNVNNMALNVEKLEAIAGAGFKPFHVQLK